MRSSQDSGDKDRVTEDEQESEDQAESAEVEEEIAVANTGRQSWLPFIAIHLI